MLNTRFLSPTDQKCADSSTYWQFFHYRPPGELRYTAGPISKILCKNSIYIYIERERASSLKLIFISSTWDCTTFHNFLPMFKKKKKKIFKSWQVYDWLAKWLIMSGYMDLRQPRVYRRSNVGLVVHYISCNCRLYLMNKVQCLLFVLNNVYVHVTLKISGNEWIAWPLHVFIGHLLQMNHWTCLIKCTQPHWNSYLRMHIPYCIDRTVLLCHGKFF